MTPPVLSGSPLVPALLAAVQAAAAPASTSAMQWAAEPSAGLPGEDGIANSATPAVARRRAPDAGQEPAFETNNEGQAATDRHARTAILLQDGAANIGPTRSTITVLGRALTRTC